MSQAPTFAPIPRVPTGIPGLDVILRGGLLQGGLYIIFGTPGAGKTILANQIAFHHVAMGGKVAYITLLAENHARMLSHLGMMRFFTTAPVANGLSYISAYRSVKEAGLRGLLEFVRQVVREQRATILVIDGLVTAEEFAGSEVDYKQFIHELHTYLEAVDCTGLLLSQDDGGNETAAAHTMVDGLIELRDTVAGLRGVRELRVRKFRGSNHLRGYHMFDITDVGLTIHPRTEVTYTRQPGPLLVQSRVALGVVGLDTMLRGGVPMRSATLAMGLPGSGKTTLATHFLAAGVAAGEPGLLFSFNETAEDIAGLADGFGLNLRTATAAVEVLWQLPGEHHIDMLAERLLDAVSRHGARRVVIDSLAGFQAAAISPERVGIFLAALLNELRACDVTTLVLMETTRVPASTEEQSRLGVAPLFDNILLLSYDEVGAELRRTLRVIKMRRSGFEPGARPLTLTDQGLVMVTAPHNGELANPM